MKNESETPFGDHLKEVPVCPPEKQEELDTLVGCYSNPEATGEVKRSAAEKLINLLKSSNPPVLRPARTGGGLHDCLELLQCICEENINEVEAGNKSDIPNVHLFFDEEDLSHPPKERMGPDDKDGRSYLSERDAALLYKILKFHSDSVTVNMSTVPLSQKVSDALIDVDYATHDSRDAFRNLGHPQQHLAEYLCQARLKRLFASKKSPGQGEEAFIREVFRILQEAHFPHVYSDGLQDGYIGIGQLMRDIDRFLSNRAIYQEPMEYTSLPDDDELVSRLASSLILTDHPDLSSEQVNRFVTDVSHYPHHRCLLQILEPLQVARNIRKIEQLCEEKILQLHIDEPEFDGLRKLMMDFLAEEDVQMEMRDPYIVERIAREFRKEILEDGHARIGVSDAAVRKLQLHRQRLRRLLNDHKVMIDSDKVHKEQHALHETLGELADQDQLRLEFPEHAEDGEVLGVMRGVSVFRCMMRDILGEAKQNRVVIRLNDQAANILANRFEYLASSGKMTLQNPDEKVRARIIKDLEEMKAMKVERSDLISKEGRNALTCLQVTPASQFSPRAS